VGVNLWGTAGLLELPMLETHLEGGPPGIALGFTITYYGPDQQL